MPCPEAAVTITMSSQNVQTRGAYVKLIQIIARFVLRII